MLDKSPLASLRVRLSAASAMPLTSPRKRARSSRSFSLNGCIFGFFLISVCPVTALFGRFLKFSWSLQ